MLLVMIKDSRNNKIKFKPMIRINKLEFKLNETKGT
jgi:hypothetical protein